MQGNMMSIRNIRKFVWWVVALCLLLTWLPYLGIFNSPELIWGIPQPLALTLVCNAVLTICIISLYPLYFKPLMNALKARPIVEEHSHE
jgi:hypothetical protein